MKKVIALITALILIVGSAAAEIPDLSGLSEDELFEVIHEAQAILFASNLVEGVRVPQGTYTVGIDIPAGTYRIEITDGNGYYEVYDKPDGRLLHAGITGSGYDITEIGKITLEGGYVLSLINSSFVFYPYVGIFH
jgi:hypothetical protein